MSGDVPGYPSNACRHCCPYTSLVDAEVEGMGIWMQMQEIDDDEGRAMRKGSGSEIWERGILSMTCLSLVSVTCCCW